MSGNIDPNDKSSEQDNFSRYKPDSLTKQEICRPDPQDREYMICNTLERRLENRDGENAVIDNERSERIPFDFRRINHFDSHTRDEMKSMASNLVDNLFTFGEEAKSMENNFKRGVDSFLGDSAGFFNNVYREANQAFNHFQKAGQEFENFLNQKHPEKHQSESERSENSTNTTIPKYNNKSRTPQSDQEIYDV